ncbi:MAG TPA: hypothetical protein VIK04_14780 [Solirubrobacteraceae bacterium]
MLKPTVAAADVEGEVNISYGRQWYLMSAGSRSKARASITRRFGLIVTGTIAVVVPAPATPVTAAATAVVAR